MNIIIFGPQGCGKGTQAGLVAERFGIPHISTGDMFRAAIGQKTDLGMQIKDKIEKGVLIPDEISIRVVELRLKETDCAEGFILDGFPRTIAQAEALDAVAEIDLVIVLDVPDNVLIERLSKRRICSKCNRVTSVDEGSKCRECGGELVQRADDTSESIKKRLSAYKDQTEPLIEYYRPRDLVCIIDGNRPVEPIFKDIIKILGE